MNFFQDKSTTFDFHQDVITFNKHFQLMKYFDQAKKLEKLRSRKKIIIFIDSILIFFV